jgi:hypothetical protein
MLRPLLFAGFITAAMLTPAYADEQKEWCNDAHMQKMNAMIAKMTDPAKQKSAQMHIDESDAAMKKGDMAGCVEHMKEAHKDMGL